LKKRYLNPEDIKEVVTLRLAGVEVSVISERFGYFDNRTIEKVLQREGIKVGRQYSGRTDRVQYNAQL